MIRCLLLALGIGSALGGVSIQMPYLNPAGVTYTGLHAGVSAIPSQLHYSAATTSSVAYGNGAFLGRSSLSPAVSYAAPVAHYAAPVAQYAHVAQYAAPVVPTVHHVPAVAQVPVTKYEAQPAVIQNLVDVAKPKLASRKFEIRRPAIQKQFYDVEERVIIRPAGSAVVELDQPVSKSQRGPTVVRPAVHAVSAPVVGFRALHNHHHVVPAAYPGAFSVHHYPIQGPAAIQISSTPAPPQEIEAQPEEIPQQPQQFTEQQEPQQIPQQESQQGFQQFPQQEPQQFDDSDSVAVDNPDIARVRSQQPQPEQPQQAQSFQSFTQQQGQEQLFQSIPQPQDFLRRSQLFAPQQQLLERFQAMNAERQQAIARSQVQAQEQVVAQLQAQAQAQQAQLQRSEQLLQLQQQQLVRSRQAVESVSRSQLEQQQQEQQSQPQPQSAPSSRSQSEQSEGLSSVGPEPQRGSVRILEAGDLRSALIDNIARSTSSPSEIPSFRISPEQSISNQERLISLLTARGGVVEARSQGESSDSNQVRARVLSVTPAPEGASPQEEKVNTRRIVVSHPIQTVEEVDEVEPFTKIERVAVHSPAVIKTAHHGVAHLPTSVPVHGYAHALHY